jgi:hypothetical protein
MAPETTHPPPNHCTATPAQPLHCNPRPTAALHPMPPPRAPVSRVDGKVTTGRKWTTGRGMTDDRGGGTTAGHQGRRATTAPQPPPHTARDGLAPAVLLRDGGSDPCDGHLLALTEGCRCHVLRINLNRRSAADLLSTRPYRVMAAATLGNILSFLVHLPSLLNRFLC